MGEAISKVNDDIMNINNWIINNGMNLNPNKTQSIIVGSKNSQNKITNNVPCIRVCEKDIAYSKTVKYLGYNFNSSFTSVDHVNSIAKRVNLNLHYQN